MVSIDARDPDAAGRRVPGHWEGDLIIGRAGATAAATLVERTSRYTIILALPDGKQSEGVCDALIESADALPDMMRRTLTWDQGTEMARHAALTVATGIKVYFADPHSPWQRGTNENTNGLIREYLPKGTPITDHQPYLDRHRRRAQRETPSRPRLPHPTRILRTAPPRTTPRCFHALTPSTRDHRCARLRADAGDAG